MSQTFFWDCVRDDGETEIVVVIAVNNWGCAAQTYGPPENCYPGEGLECEVVKAWLKANENRIDPPFLHLSDSERERIEREFCEDPPEDSAPEEDW